MIKDFLRGFITISDRAYLDIAVKEITEFIEKNSSTQSFQAIPEKLKVVRGLVERFQ